MAVEGPRWLTELCAHIELAGERPSLLLLVTRDAAHLNEVRRTVAALLRHGGIAVDDVGPLATDEGPTAWSERTRHGEAAARVFSVAPTMVLATAAFAERANAQRESLRDAVGPMVLVLSAETEAALRKQAPDFATWIAASWELPAIDALTALATERGAVLRAPAAAAPPIRFLHLSDLHLRSATSRKIDQDRVLRGLYKRLEADRSTAPLDLIFLTGDLAQSGSSDEYVHVTALLKRLMEVTGVPRERIFAVPGNHDVDRGAGRWLLRTLPSDEASTEFFGIAANRRWHTQKFEAWSVAMRDTLGDRPHGLTVGADAVEFVEVRGTRIAVALFNTAWFAYGDDDKGQLWLGQANLEAAAATAAQAELAIALMHHPVDELAEAEREVVGNHLERSFDLLLRGHLHKTRAQVVIGGRGTLAELAAPAGYQGSRWANGCFVGELRRDPRTLRVLPLTFGNGADPWTVDPKVFPDDASDGHAHTFRLDERTPRSEREVLAQANAQDLFWRLPTSRRLALAERLGIEGASTREVEERTAERLLRSPEGAEVLREFTSRASAPEVPMEVHEQIKSPYFREAIARYVIRRISRQESDFLPHALETIAAVWGDFAPVSGSFVRQTSAGRVVIDVLAACIEGRLRTAYDHRDVDSHGKFKWPPFSILIGDDSDPPNQRAVLRLSSAPARNDVSRAIARTNAYRDVFHAEHAALIVVGDMAQSAPGIQEERAPDGRPVWVLRLPN